MNVKYLFLLLPFFLLLTACSPDPVDTTGSISGTIYDADESDRPLKGVQVTITGHETSITKTSDAQGKFSFANIEIGEYTIQASLQDYATQTATVYVSVGQQRQQDFHLRRARSDLYVVNHQLDFGVTTNQIGLDIENRGQALMKWEVIENIDWLEFSPRSGEVRSGDKATITVIVNRSGKEFGDYKGSFVISTKDSGSETINVTMSVSSGSDESLPQVSMLGVDGETDISAHFSGEIVSCGTSRVLRHGFVWDIEDNPSLEKGSTYQNLGATDEPKPISYSPSNLDPNTTYYVRAFATNSTGTVYSRQEIRFTTLGERKRPNVETGAASQITSSTATLNGNLLEIGNDIGVTQHGHIWSSTQTTPTLDNTSPTKEQTKLGQLKQTTSFSSNLSRLKPGTTYYYCAYATNAQGTGYGEVRQFTTTCAEVKLSTKSVSDVIHNEATCGGIIKELGGNSIVERGVCWSTSATPTLANSYSASTDNTDDFSVRMTNLTTQTKYYVRAYVKTGLGETYYGQEIQFTTTQEVFLPQASATTITNVSAVSVTVSAFVSDNGNGTVKDKGFCYSTSPSPTVSDNKYSCGNNASSFTTTLSGLNENTHYYVRAYVVNERGTGYGEQVEFQTLQLTLPTLSSVTITGISFRAATFEASVESLGNGTIKRSGFCYGMSHNPTINNTTISCEGKKNLKASVSALDAETTYYVRAFAENEKGFAYGEEKSFTTLEGSNVKIEDWDDDENWNF